MSGSVTRRVFLSGVSVATLRASAAAGPVFPSEARRYPDAATEFEVLRLTDPAHTSQLPPYYNRALGHRGASLIYTCDRSGAVQAYQMDLKNFTSRQLTSVANGLEPNAVALASDEKALYYAAGNSVWSVNISNEHQRTMYEAPAGCVVRNIALSDDTTHLFAVESSGGAYRLRVIRMVGSGPSGNIESPEPLSEPMPRPKRAGVLYRRGGQLWLASYDTAQNYRLRIAAGGVGPACWSADGRTILYLNFPEEGKSLHGIREFDPDSNEDRQVANTSQYVHFGRNADASVFVGSSGSKASPYVLLLVRSVKRELALCEHRASDPSQVAPIFAPNSQRVFFQSDRHGKMAIYSIRVERLVEETDTGSA